MGMSPEGLARVKAQIAAAELAAAGAAAAAAAAAAAPAAAAAAVAAAAQEFCTVCQRSRINLNAHAAVWLPKFDE